MTKNNELFNKIMPKDFKEKRIKQRKENAKKIKQWKKDHPQSIEDSKRRYLLKKRIPKNIQQLESDIKEYNTLMKKKILKKLLV